MANKIKPEIAFPVKGCRKGATKAYSLIVVDASNVEHFFDEYGNYEGWGKSVEQV